MKQHDAAQPHADQGNLAGHRKLKTVSSEDLFEGAREMHIDHKGVLYTLKITRQGKLILNK